MAYFFGRSKVRNKNLYHQGVNPLEMGRYKTQPPTINDEAIDNDYIMTILYPYSTKYNVVPLLCVGLQSQSPDKAATIGS